MKCKSLVFGVFGSGPGVPGMVGGLYWYFTLNDLGCLWALASCLQDLRQDCSKLDSFATSGEANGDTTGAFIISKGFWSASI